MSPLAHIDNYAFMLEQYGFELRYNQITKDAEWSHSGGEMCRDTDNADESLYALTLSLCALNGLSTQNLGSMLTAVYDRNQYNPVTDVLKDLKWDRESRMAWFAEKCATENDEIALIVLKTFFLSACAAADGGEIGCKLNGEAHPTYEYVLVLSGEQGINKTKGLRNLLPPELRQYFGESTVLTVGNRDSEKEAVSHWVTELGELDATFRKSAISHLKGFTCRREDQMRLPYGRAWVRYKRRTVFVATVNETKFLHDETGNRRFMPIAIDRLPSLRDDVVLQLWAEAWYEYTRGAQWWPTEKEAELLLEAICAFEEETPVMEALRKYYDWEAPPYLRTNRRLMASEIYGKMYESRYTARPKDTSDISAAMKKLWLEAGGCIKKGELVVEVDGSWVKANSSGGKNRGWIHPPLKS